MDFLQYTGPYHPLLLHLPIGILFLAFLMQLFDWRSKKEQYQAAIQLALLIGMISAIFSAITGYGLSLAGGYEENLLQKHQYLGIGVALLSILVYLFHRTKSAFYTPTFFLLMVLLVGAGHFGGSLTHGADFLTSGKKNTQPLLTSMESAVLFPDIIQPILKEKCVRCHNASKTKGELLMATIAGIQKGGESGALLVAGDTLNSLLLKRIHLPLEEEKHMPPKGKKQLTTEEVQLLNWWIKEGASFDKNVSAYALPFPIQTILNKYIQPKEALPSKGIKRLGDKELATLRQKGIPIHRLHIESPFVEVDLSRKQQISKLLKQLKKVNSQIVSLNLSYTDIKDGDLSIIENLPHLQKLYLQKTGITDKALSSLKELAYLEYLNLYGTGITDDGLTIIKDLPRLKKLYLWQSETTSEGIAKLTSYKPRLDIQAGVNQSIFGDASLKPPLIVSERDLFQDSLEVALKMNFNNVSIYYTTDGTLPDSTATLYTAPFSISKTSKVSAIAQKEGWQSSEVIERQFVQAKYTPVDIQLNKAPNDRYKADGAPSLIDFQKGTITFTDGNWLGYENSHFIATLDLGKAQPINGITVSALEATGSYIFYPKGMEVSVSVDNKKFQPVLSKTFPTTQVPLTPEVKNFTEDFPTIQTARYVRVKVKSNLVNPDWHPAPGAPCWVFVDEILVQ